MGALKNVDAQHTLNQLNINTLGNVIVCVSTSQGHEVFRYLVQHYSDVSIRRILDEFNN